MQCCVQGRIQDLCSGGGYKNLKTHQKFVHIRFVTFYDSENVFFEGGGGSNPVNPLPLETALVVYVVYWYGSTLFFNSLFTELQLYKYKIELQNILRGIFFLPCSAHPLENFTLPSYALRFFCILLFLSFTSTLGCSSSIFVREGGKRSTSGESRVGAIRYVFPNYWGSNRPSLKGHHC